MKFRLVAAVVISQGIALLTSAAHANVILTYTGNSFTSFGPPGQTRYTTAHKVTASLTLANPLDDNLAFTGVTPLAFSISDGVQTLTSENPLNEASSAFATPDLIVLARLLSPSPTLMV